jgi:hypothetical protein
MKESKWESNVGVVGWNNNTEVSKRQARPQPTPIYTLHSWEQASSVGRTVPPGKSGHTLWFGGFNEENDVDDEASESDGRQ